MTLIFDYDGTLHDTSKIYIESVKKVINDLISKGIIKEKEFEDEELVKYLGWSPIDMWNDFLPELDSSVRDWAINEVGTQMNNLLVKGESRLYDFVPEILTELKEKGHNLIFLSNCTNRYLKSNKDHYDLEKWFDRFYCSEAYNYLPKAEIFKFIEKENEGPFVVIGDRFSDIEVAINNDLLSIGCNYGYGLESELDKADFHINSPIEILEVINQI